MIRLLTKYFFNHQGKKDWIILVFLQIIGILTEAQIYGQSTQLRDVESLSTYSEPLVNKIEELNNFHLLKPSIITYFREPKDLNQFILFCDTTSKQKIDFVNAKSEYHWFHYVLELKKPLENGVFNVPDFQINQLQLYVRNPKNQIEKVIHFGDELHVDSFNYRTRTCQGGYHFQDSGIYHIYVKYYRAGVPPTLYLELSNISEFIKSWNQREWLYGVIFAFLATYLLFIFWVLINKPTIYFTYFFIWVIMNFIYYIISAGHFKYYFISGSENWYSGIRQASVIGALFGITQFALTHYNQREKLRWVTWVSTTLVLLTFSIIFSTWFSEKPIYTGYEAYFVGAIRLVIVGFVVLQFILPFRHYRAHKEFTFLSVVLIVAVINLIGYIILSSKPHNANFDDFNIFSIIILVFEIVVVAWGALKFAIAQENQKTDLILQKIQLQKEINQRQNDVQEKERMRIAMELHDDVLNRMSILMLLARDKYIDKAEISKNLNEIGRDIKHYILGLYPYWTKEAELNQVIFNNLNEIAAKLKIQLTIQVDEKKLNLSKLQKLQLFRLAQEFIQNAGKHGKANQVIFKIFEQDSEFYLEFQDDGIGFDPEEIIQGLGTQGAKQRIQTLGGTMSIETTKGKGVRWIITIPKFSSSQTLVPMS